jgi:hypothetical protein
MKKTSTLLAALVAILALALGAVGVASAATPPDKPVISSASAVLGQSDLGPFVQATVGGYNFTPGGKVLVRYYDATSDPHFQSPFGEGTTTAGNRLPINGEGGNYGQIYMRTVIARGTSHCNHWLYAAAWDYVKSPNTAYQWSFKPFFFSCP